MAEITSHHTLGNKEANELCYKLMQDVASKTANFLKENGYSNLFLFFHPNTGEAEASYEDELIDHTQRGWLICGPSSNMPFTTTLWEKTLIPHRKYVVENWGKKTEEELRNHLINEMQATPRHADFHINFMKEQEAKLTKK